MSQVTLFISAVTSEFAEDPARSPERVRRPGDYRTYLRDKLTGPDVSVKVQEDFIAGGVLTLDKLVLYLKECDAVIQLVGDMTGAVASDIAVESLFATEPQLPRNVPFLAAPADAATLGVSYTQWEGYLAHHYAKRLLVCAAEPHAPRAARHMVDEAQRTSQDAYLARLKQLERYLEIVFASREELVIEVLRTLRTMLPLAKRESLPAPPLRLPYASLGELFIGRGEFLAAIRASVEINEAHFGEPNPQAFSDSMALARVLDAAQRYDEATVLYQRAIDASEGPEAPNPLSVAMCHVKRGHALKALGRLPEAEESLRRTLIVAEREFPPGDAVIARSLIELAEVVHSLGRRGAAASLVCRALDIVNGLSEEVRAMYDFSPGRLALLDGAGDTARDTPAPTPT